VRLFLYLVPGCKEMRNIRAELYRSAPLPSCVSLELLLRKDPFFLVQAPFLVGAGKAGRERDSSFPHGRHPPQILTSRGQTTSAPLGLEESLVLCSGYGFPALT